MVILAIDSSGKQGSIAIARGGDGKAAGSGFEEIETLSLIGGTFSAQLVPQISDLLVRHSLTKHVIDAFAVVSGPGSFTGLRVGLAVVKALAEILDKPIAALSLLEVCVASHPEPGKWMAALDAGRGDVYVGEYDMPAIAGSHPREYMLSRDQFLSQAKRRQIVTPDPMLAEVCRAAVIPVENIPPITAAAVARLGMQKIRSGESVTSDQLQANYIRRTDAEMLERLRS